MGTTKNCTDCHISKQNDNNAIMTQLLGFGNGSVNFFGRYAYVGAGKEGLYGVIWTEQEEPQAAIGSHLQKLAYPDNFKAHADKNKGQLKEAYHHHAREILDLTLRGEYLYTANGADGFEVFDVANIDQKGFSERIVTAPVSPLGQRTYVKTKYATSVTLPSTLGIDPLRTRNPENEEQPIHLAYAYVYITDKLEGLVMVNVGTLVDGDPANNFLKKDIVFNPDGWLNGATHSFLAGRYLYVTADKGLLVIDVDKPSEPRLVGRYIGDFLKYPRAVALQFRYLFVTDSEGLKVLDVTKPTEPKPVTGGVLKLANAQRFYLARTYAYVANGAEGLAIVDIEKPEQPKLDQMFNAGGVLNDTRAVQIGAVNASMFALVADGKNGLRVIQVISPENVPQHMGFSPKPNPKLIATYPTSGPAVAVSRGLDRDRVVDESGNQTVVFGRRGARPFNKTEMEKFYLRNGQPYAVEDVVLNNGQLQTRSGQALKPNEQFKPMDESAATKPVAQERLIRRGK
ncbi:MAG: hypothetical protein H7X97_02795 [Opitutaceae bacterium]|nr:hypothetical protein [Verrucomicrobiales bacterium]